MKNLIILVIIIITLIIGWFYHLNTIKELKNSYEKSFINEKQTFVKNYNSLHEEIVTQDQNILVKDDKIKELLIKNTKLSDINIQLNLKSQNKVDTLISYVVDSTGKIDIKTIDETEYIKVGTKFSKENKWYSANGSLTKKGIKLDFRSNEYLTIDFGIEKKKFQFFRKLDHKIEIINRNPYSSIIEVNNSVFKEKVPFYQTNLFYFSLGGLVTTLILLR